MVATSGARLVRKQYTQVGIARWGCPRKSDQACARKLLITPSNTTLKPRNLSDCKTSAHRACHFSRSFFPTQASHNQRETRCRNMVMMIAATRHHDSKTCRRQRFQPTSFTKSPFFMRMLFLRKTPGHWTVILFAAESTTNWWITMTRLPFLSN